MEYFSGRILLYKRHALKQVSVHLFNYLLMKPTILFLVEFYNSTQGYRKTFGDADLYYYTIVRTDIENVYDLTWVM